MLQGDREAMKRGSLYKVEGGEGTSFVKSYYCVLLGEVMDEEIGCCTGGGLQNLSKLKVIFH